MATKEKWIDLFEKAVGRPPHALEIEEGQKADFDLKAIKGIAAMGLDQEATPSEPTEEVDEYDVAEEMFDDVTKVKISKTDITGDVEIPGAKLTILDKDDQVVESWISTSEPHYVEKLPIGKYTLREEQAPKGFILSNDVTFEVADTGEVQMVAMKG